MIPIVDVSLGIYEGGQGIEYAREALRVHEPELNDGPTPIFRTISSTTVASDRASEIPGSITPFEGLPSGTACAPRHAMRSLVVLGILSAVNVASAEDLPRFGLAVNNPLMWFVDPGNDGKAFAISGYVGVSDHIAVRANVATYPVDRIRNFASTDGYVDGSTTDVGVGAVLYQRHRFAGTFVEFGAFRRSSPGYRIVGYQTVGDGYKLEWAGRTLFGYSWELTRHLWIAAAVGWAVGHETGAEIEMGDDFNHPTPVTRTHFDHLVTSGEWMFRIGSAF